MKKDKYELAKKLLIKNYYDTSHFNKQEKEEWDSYNVPEELVIEWVMDHLETLVKEIYAILDDKSNIQEEKLNTILIKTTILLDDVDNYKIIWYKKIVEIIKKIDERITLGRALTMRNGWDRLILNICLFLSDKEKDLRYLEFFSNHYLYDTGEQYFGLLPYLYKIKEYELFNELFDLLYKYLDDYKELNMEKHFDIRLMFIEYAKYMNMDYEKYLK